MTRELFSCTVLYIFIFALLTASPFNSVLSKYMSDVIYEETYADIMACYYVGLFLNILLSSLVGIPFCIHEYLVGKVDIIYVFTGYCGYVALALVFYSMLYLSICKDYQKISLFFLMGMAVQKAVSETDEAGAKRRMQASYSQRNLMQMLWAVLAIVLPCFQFAAGILPLLIPGTAIKLMGIKNSIKR